MRDQKGIRQKQDQSPTGQTLNPIVPCLAPRANHKCDLQGFDEFAAEFYKTFENAISSVLKFFKEMERDGVFPNSFMEPSITQIPKLRKDTNKKENYRPIS